MTDDSRTLWIGNLDGQVQEELLYELFLQTGPIEKLILPTEGEGDSKKHKGHAYIVFLHTESVQYASQVMEGSCLFGLPLTLKARNLPTIYKSTTPTAGNKGRFDNTHKPGFNKAATWHGGQNDFSSRGRGSFRGRGGGGAGSSNYTQNSGSNSYNSQSSTGFWMGGQQTNSDNQVASYNTSDNSMDEKRQRLLQQQNLTLEAQRQIQQGVMNMASQMYGIVQQQSQQQTSQQQQQQQGTWSNNSGYSSTSSWNMAGGDTSNYQGYTADQYGNWYQQQ